MGGVYVITDPVKETGLISREFRIRVEKCLSTASLLTDFEGLDF